jgi:ribosomal protein S18 acetylase RimI-like enzyme
LFSFRNIDLTRDIETIVKFRRDSYIISFGDDSLFGDNDSYIKKIKERITKFPGGLVIVEIDEIPIGQIELQIKQVDNKDIGYVNLFYLVTEYRGQGFGTKLIDYAESFFIENNISEYQLRVSFTNKRAIRFYQKNGFELLMKEEDTIPRFRMQKLLS